MSSLDDARQKLPLDRLMPMYGYDVPPLGSGRRSFKCPLCQNKGSASLRQDKGKVWFKCFDTGCPSSTCGERGSWDEVKFYGWKHGLNATNGGSKKYSEAAVAYMKEAGVWKEADAFAPSVMPGQQRRKKPMPTPPSDPDSIVAAAQAAQAESPADFVPPSPEKSRPESVSVEAGTGVTDADALADAAAVARLAVESALEPVSRPAAGITGVPESAAAAVAAAVPQVLLKKVEVDLTGRAALREFYSELPVLTEKDELMLWEKRGLTSVTSLALGFRSNPRENREIIEALLARRGEREMVASGLLLAADRKRNLGVRINTQFCGKGQAGKIPKAERKDPKLKVQWGWTEPVLIPYYDEAGELCALRPHKGGAPAASAAGGKGLYVPRAVAVNAVFRRLTEKPLDVERFETVVVTEGEFKAAALWQTVGQGQRQFVDDAGVPLFEGGEVGVCAVPGISYAKHFETREVLEAWLLAVGCRRVVVAFDREQKQDREKYPEAYEPDMKKRHDAQVYARYMAMDIARKLHIRGEICTLPAAWLNVKGKADWDGALADMGDGQQTNEKDIWEQEL